MITLYKFGPIEDVCDPSPFCVKVEAYLRMVNLPYEARCGAQYLRKAPKRKLSYIEDNGRLIADSTFILKYLKDTYGDTLDAGYNTEDKAISHAISKMIEENLYWNLVYARWQLESNRITIKDKFFTGLIWPLNRIVPVVARRQFSSALYYQGLGRHSETEILEIGNRDLNRLLKNGPMPSAPSLIFNFI